MKNEDKKPDRLKLPQRLVTPVDLSRTTRELKMLDEWLTQAALRTPGAAVTPPKTSVTLEEMASLNGVSLLEESHRQQLINVLSKFEESAPKIHMSFAVEPSAAFLDRMIVWLRSNVSPLILLQVGLQPTLVAGCTVRTTNRMFDMSLRHRFVESRPQLVKSIEEVTKDLPAPAASAEVPQPEVVSTAATVLNAAAGPAPQAPPVTEPAVAAEVQSPPQPEANPASVQPAPSPATVTETKPEPAPAAPADEKEQPAEVAK